MWFTGVNMSDIEILKTQVHALNKTLFAIMKDMNKRLNILEDIILKNSNSVLEVTDEDEKFLNEIVGKDYREVGKYG
jgi:pantothenate kinase-related protein Tda10